MFYDNFENASVKSNSGKTRVNNEVNEINCDERFDNVRKSWCFLT